MSSPVTEQLSPSDLQTMETLTAENNADLLQKRRAFEAKYPGSFAPAALAPQTEYAIESWRFEYVALFYITVWATVKYKTGEERAFEGNGGGVAAGMGAYWGGAPNTYFNVSPAELVGMNCQFYFMPVSIGALIHFWTNSTNIGTLVGAGPALGIGAFGGSGTWSAKN